MAAAGELGRKWIGIDSSDKAISVAKTKLLSKKATLFSDYSFDFLTLNQEDIEKVQI